ncbi:S8 family serine peptidase [Halomarina rubra]|uniref:S8 family serine peptidase n=1 Tax=Halomarina rubra TaxID=2071873 RepID=A0ABD6AQP9_9EURY|nr:S8 family serine peptidase [Halomarina rubra]
MSSRRVVVVALVCALVLAPVTDFPATADDRAVNVDPVDSLRVGLDEQRQEPPTVDQPAAVILRLKGTASVPDTARIDVERTYTRAGDRIVEGSVSYTEIRQLSRNPRITSVSITGAALDRTDTVSPGVSVVGADELHAANVTGENVTVGIIDSDFRMSHPAVARTDTTYRAFDAGGDWEHGTAVASVVADTAPDADLRLAAVGPTTSPEEYREAVDWLVEGRADVVVDSGSYYAQPGDGTGTLGRIVANVSEDVVFVTSAGNHANRYWAGNYTDGSFVNFTDTDDRNYLNDGESFSGAVDVSVRWDGWPTTADDFDVYLYRDYPGGDYAVAKATGHEGQPFEHLSTTVAEGRYYVGIHAKNVSEPHRVELFTSHDLSNRSTGGTTAPASAAGVVTVGAVDNGTLRPFSARTNVDLVAPDGVALSGASIDGGTSFAAPYVAGVAALTVDANPEMNATEVRQHLYDTAVDLGVDGIDDGSGHGVVSAAGILAATGDDADETSDDTETTPAEADAETRKAGAVAVVARG